MIDAHLAELLTASRARWIERAAGAEWHEWVARTAANAYRGRAPAFASIRIHSLPGSQWEVLKDGRGTHCLVADDELTATLAELRLLSMPGAKPDSGYDKGVLMLADGFRAAGDLYRYSLCLGWALPRSLEIQRHRQLAIDSSGQSAETMVVLLHEVAHRVFQEDDDSTQWWRDACAVGVDKVLASLSQGGQFRDQAVSDGVRLGLGQEDAVRQITTYLDHIRDNKELLEELACDLLAVVAFLNLNSQDDVIAEPQSGPKGMSTKQVGDALFVAHGAIQNMQLLTTVQAIAASASTGSGASAGPLDRATSELTARSTVLVFLLSNLLQAWCEQGHLRVEWPAGVPNVKGALLAAIQRRNSIRVTALLDPLQDLDGVFHEPERFQAFERMGLEQLSKASIQWPARRKQLDGMRWALTMANTQD
jgi:hypothetical protein